MPVSGGRFLSTRMKFFKCVEWTLDILFWILYWWLLEKSSSWKYEFVCQKLCNQYWNWTSSAWNHFQDWFNTVQNNRGKSAVVQSPTPSTVLSQERTAVQNNGKDISTIQKSFPHGQWVDYDSESVITRLKSKLEIIAPNHLRIQGFDQRFLLVLLVFSVLCPISLSKPIWRLLECQMITLHMKLAMNCLER